jgi:hypothetical protein
VVDTKVLLLATFAFGDLISYGCFHHIYWHAVFAHYEIGRLTVILHLNVKSHGTLHHVIVLLAQIQLLGRGDVGVYLILLRARAVHHLGIFVAHALGREIQS